jgi:tetratricopeptide (TPR) repeat protein
MQTNDKAHSALLSTIPTAEAWKAFSQNSDNTLIIDTLVNYAARSGLIPAPEVQLLEKYVLRQVVHRTTFRPPKHLGFDELLNKKEEILKVGISLRGLTERINALLAENQIALPKVTNSMLTRLKKEPVDTAYKQNVLRSMAFWLGHERPDIAAHWHYDTLLTVCREGRQTENYKEGARIGFALYSRGDVIDHEILGWLRKTVKTYIDQSISHFSYGRWGKVRSHDITTLYVDFPKETPAGDLVAYQQCLRSAVSLAHQMAIRWALSRYNTKNRFLSIAVVIGEFAGLDNHLLPLLSAKLPDDPAIRLSDLARQCVLINDIRVVLCPAPTETTLFNGESLSIWWVEAFWSTLYFDFVSELLADPILQNNPASTEKLNRLLLRIPTESPAADVYDEPNAVTAFFKFPHNSLLGLEIAKTLYYRRRFSEALEILRVVLSINPTDLIARTLRMILLRNIALDAPTYETADGLFRQAKKEARFIEANCACQSEDFYCEYAVVHMAQAMKTLRHARTNRKLAKNRDALVALKNNVYEALEAAENLFEDGIAVSPSGIRSSYLLNSVRLLQAYLKEDEDIFVNPRKPVSGKIQTGRDVAVKVHWQIGYRSNDVPEETLSKIAEELMVSKAKIHDDAITLQSYRPTIYFCHAVALWDFTPLRSIMAMKRAEQVMRMAIHIAESVKKDNVCIYSFTRTYGEMITPDEFIRHINNCINLMVSAIEDETGKSKGREAALSDKNLWPCLMTLNF